MPFGICKLCLQEQNLQKQPPDAEGSVRQSTGSGSTGNQDPFVLSKNCAKQSSYQTKDYVLCRECEDRLNKNGEMYVMGLVTKRNRQFPLLEAMRSVKPTMKTKNWEMYSEKDTPSIDRVKIAYFAMSVFWRASVHTWILENGSEVRIDLGRKYNEQIRTYLMDQSPVPRNVYLQLVLCSDALNQRTFFFPKENAKVPNRAVGFCARNDVFSPCQQYSHRCGAPLVDGERVEWVDYGEGLFAKPCVDTLRTDYEFLGIATS